MKKILTTVAAVFALVAVSNAQLFIGGNVGFATNGETNKNIDGDGIKQGSTMSINFMPKIGYQLNDQLSAGAYLILSTESAKNFDGTKDNKVVGKDVTNGFGITPFVRYAFVEFGDFKVSADATLPFVMSSDKLKPEDGDATTTEKRMSVALNVKPVVSYSISDRIDLEAAINVFTLGLDFTSVTPFPEGENGQEKIRNNSTSFNLGVQDNVVDSGAISIGMIFKF